MSEEYCNICGNGISPDTDGYENNSELIRANIEELPDDWTCPECKTDKISIGLWTDNFD